MAPADLSPLATTATPDELVIGPGLAVKTLIDAAVPLMRPAISNTEIGPAASNNWKPGNTRTPMIVLPNILNRGNPTFQTSGHHVRMTPSSHLEDFIMSAPPEIGLLLFPKLTQAV